jgi:hypothetical protein
MASMAAFFRAKAVTVADAEIYRLTTISKRS